MDLAYLHLWAAHDIGQMPEAVRQFGNAVGPPRRVRVQRKGRAPQITWQKLRPRAPFCDR